MAEPRIAVFTNAARNYLPKVRVLFDSLEEHHPQWERKLVLAERSVLPRDREVANASTVTCVTELDIPDWEAWSFCHQLVELATAIQPFALQKIMNASEVDY